MPCAHCGLPALPDSSDPAPAFCCSGCRVAYATIRACGLDGYYDVLRAQTQPAAPARTSGGEYDSFDDPAFQRVHCQDLPDGERSVLLVVEGLRCAACVWLLERAPGVLPGLLEARADLARGRLRLRWRPDQISLSRIAAFIDRLGYALHPLRERSAQEARTREDRAALVRIGVAGALFGNTMLVAFALYAGQASGMEPAFALFFRAISAALATLAVLWPGRIFFRGALASIRVRALHMDVPIALALLVGLAHGLTNTLRASGEVYFDTLTTLVFLLLIGRFIQQRQQRRAADALELLFSLTPSTAVRVDGDALRTVPVEALHIGDIVEVNAGASAPVDGVIVSGRSSVDLSLLTGESRPLDVGPGDAVAAGCVNLASPIRVRVAATGRETRVGRLMALVEAQAQNKAPVVRMADRLVGWFVVIVLLAAGVTTALWWSTSPESAVERAVALLIVTCPCALGLATPLAMVAGIGRAARRSILVKGGDVIEALSRPGVVVLDKTGTVTTGRMRVAEYHGPDDLRAPIAEIERLCNHPAAVAIARHFDPDNQGLAHSAHICQTIGGGVVATVDAGDFTIGSARFVLERLGGERLPDRLGAIANDAAERGLSPVIVARDSTPLAVICLGDDVRPDARSTLDHLRSRGWRPLLLSGDDPRVVAGVGRALALPAHDVVGGASPEDKLQRIQALAARGPVVMVGDGVNDAAALAAATVGIAVHGGAEASMAAADVYLARPGLAPLAELFDGAARTCGVVRRNLAVSLGYNLVFAGLAFFGLINPLVAAIVMPISSISVVVLSFRTGAFSGDAAKAPRALRPARRERRAPRRSTRTARRVAPSASDPHEGEPTWT